MLKLTIRLALAPALCLAGALMLQATGEPGIIKGADEFEFIYRVKLPEITGAARVWIPLAKTDAFPNRDRARTADPDEMGQGAGPRLRQ